ncbi:MAG: acyl-CoA synthetase [Micrococcales bacterium]|nr:MAG: acyl-CoA synthetase [Micrococcales bacterium]
MTPTDTPLTPLAFLERAATIHPGQVAVVDGGRRLTYAQAAEHVTRLANALRDLGVRPGDRVAYITANSTEMLLAHYAVPLAHAVLVAVNTRLAPQEVRYILEHSGASVVMIDPGLWDLMSGYHQELGLRAVVSLPAQAGDIRTVAGTRNYTGLVQAGSPDPLPWEVDDEDRTITINYTSGTTGRPKGVMYTHRGAYLNSLNQVVHQRLTRESNYLWTLPMFHCNGWCNTWAVTAAAGRHVVLRAVRGADIWQLLAQEKITHLCGAPTVLTTMATAENAHQLTEPLLVTTAGAAPSPTIIEKFNAMNATVVHVYGLTETYGPYTVCEPQPEWAGLNPHDLAVQMARQGVAMVAADPVRVVEFGSGDELTDVPPDGETMGEIVMRGNCTMKGYYDDEKATADAFAGGWFHSGDLGVMHPRGYVQLLDRAKDVIISGGENISTVEVEQAVLRHQAVADVAVIAIPDETWGEVPKAIVVLDAGHDATQDDIIAHVKSHIAGYKAPKAVEFAAELPKTATGKIRKHELREKEWTGRQNRIQG